MKRNINKLIAIIMLLIILINSLPLQVFAKFITDMDSNAFFGVIPNSYEDYNHEMHYCDYDGIEYMLFCAEYNKLSVMNKVYEYNNGFWIEYKEHHLDYARIAEMICFGYTMTYGTGLPNSLEAKRAAVCTQQYVWEQLGKAPSRNSWNPNYMSDSLYMEWLNRTEGYYNQYHRGNVSFNNNTYDMKAGESLTLTDTNNILSSFGDFSSTISGVTFSHGNGSNDMNISAVDSASGTINFASNANNIYQLLPNGNSFNSSTMSTYLYFQFNSGDIQNLMFSNYLDPNFFNVSVNVEESKGDLKIKKINNLGNPVENCTFELYSDVSCTQKVATGTTNSSGEILFEKIKTGKFWVKEISVPTGYILNTSIKEVIIQRGQTATIEFTNSEPTGKILLSKVSENNDKIAGAVFSVKANEDIKNKAGTKTYYIKGQEISRITTNNEGIAQIDNLPLGQYLIKEIQAPAGYLLNSTEYTVNLVYKNQTTSQVELKVEGIKDSEPMGKILLYKISENNDKIAGAVFSVKANEDIKNKAGTKTYYIKGQEISRITTNNEGIAQIDNLPLGQYLVKEIQAPAGYLLNENSYTVNLRYKDQNTPIIELTVDGIVDNEPKGTISIIKKDSKTGSISQGDATLENAVYKVYANEDIYNVAKSKKFYSRGDLVATRNTDEKGVCQDITELPLGKYIVKEETPPVGYLIDKKEYEVNLKYKDQNTKIIAGNANSTDKVKEMRVHIFKSGIDVNSGKTPGLAGAIFNIKLNSAVQKAYDKGYTYEEVWGGIDEFGNIVTVDKQRVAEAQVIAPSYAEIETDENGDCYTGYLPYGTYVVKETSTPKDFESAEDFIFSIKDDESEIVDIAKKVKNIVVNNEQLETYIKLIKKDVKTEKIVTLSSATFQIKATKDIYDRATGKILYKKGEFVTQKVGSTVYNSFTTNAKNLIIPDRSYSNNKDVMGMITTPLKLEVGSYEITELKIPEGFLQLDEPVQFKVDGIRNYDKDKEGDYVKEVIVKNEQPTGTLIIDKSIALREDVDTSLIDTSDLSGIAFSLKVSEDVIDYSDGSIIYSKGDLVGNYNLSKEGNLTISNLPMGKYNLKEEKTLDGVVLNSTVYKIEFIKEDDITKIYTVTKEIINDTTIVDISKTDITGDKELIGAELKVIDENENIIDAWISTNKSHKIEGLKVGKSYQLIEDLAPLGFVKSTSIKFKVGNTNSVQQLIMIDKIVTMTKSDIEGKELEGAELRVTDFEGNVIDSWTSTREAHNINGLEEGKSYILYEDYAPDGYVISNQVEFTVSEDKKTQKVEMIDKLVEISKQDIAGNELEGATLVITNTRTKNIVDKWTSEKEPHKVTGLIEGETYNLHEEIVVKGYVKATDIQFTVSEDKETQKIVMIDKVVEVYKKNIEGEEIEGAKLQVFDEENNLIDEWISGIEPHRINNLEENRSYVLHEEIASNGYVKATDIVFFVTEDKETQELIMIDKIVTMTKSDIEGKKLEGAELRVTDLEGNVIDSWTSAKEAHDINGLEEGKSYILYEEITPEGYVKANDIQFTVSEDKETQKIKMIDKLVEISKVDVSGNKLEGATLVVISAKTKNIVDKWISAKEPHKVSGLMEGENYVLHEEIVIDGYVKATDIQFTVSEDKETQKIVMIDKVVEIVKTDLVTGEEIEGAELEVIDKETGEKIDKWTSTKEPHRVVGLEENKTYILKETTCPYGFEQAEEIEFTVTEDKETQLIEMKDMPILTDVTLIKTNSKTQEVIKADFIFGIYKDENCIDLIQEVTSNSENGTIIFKDLRYGTFFIKEIKEPNGFVKSDKVIRLEINDKGVFVDNAPVEKTDNIYSFKFENIPIETPNTRR